MFSKMFEATRVWVRTRARRLYTGFPHTLFVYLYDDLDWIDQPGNLRKLIRSFVGRVVLFKGLYENAESTRIGVGSVNGRLVYREPQVIARAIQNFRDHGLDVFGYLSGASWQMDKLTGPMLVDEVVRQRWDGVYLDGYGINSGGGEVGGIFETEDMLNRLRARGIQTFLHGSVAPNLVGGISAGQAAPMRMPGAREADFFLDGETTVAPKDLGGYIMWLRTRSNIEQRPLPLWKHQPNSFFANDPSLAGTILNRFMFAERISPRNVNAFMQHFLPGYLAARRRFDKDEDMLVQNATRVFAPFR